jgi:hypothetical protein
MTGRSTAPTLGSGGGSVRPAWAALADWLVVLWRQARRNHGGG